VGALIAYLDTHTAVRVRESGFKKLGKKATIALERAAEVRMSPAAVFELQILREIGKINRSPEEYLSTLADTFPFCVCDLHFADVVEAAASLSWTRDPFDRLIVAQTIVGRGELVTIDGHIRKHFSKTIWD
jgi:PIN domain nuclease of toxin-antitoxin system